MIILGIDPGTNRVGYGIIKRTNTSLEMIDYGCIDLKSDKVDSLANLPQIYKEVGLLLEKYSPEAVAIEKLFFFKNNKTVIEVSQARGIIILAALNQGFKVQEFTPLQVKQAVSGYGRAEKKGVQKMVKLLLGLESEPKPDDAADALAVAVCCANTINYMKLSGR